MVLLKKVWIKCQKWCLGGFSLKWCYDGSILACLLDLFLFITTTLQVWLGPEFQRVFCPVMLVLKLLYPNLIWLDLGISKSNGFLYWTPGLPEWVLSNRPCPSVGPLSVPH